MGPDYGSSSRTEAVNNHHSLWLVCTGAGFLLTFLFLIVGPGAFSLTLFIHGTTEIRDLASFCAGKFSKKTYNFPKQKKKITVCRWMKVKKTHGHSQGDYQKTTIPWLRPLVLYMMSHPGPCWGLYRRQKPKVRSSITAFDDLNTFWPRTIFILF